MSITTLDQLRTADRRRAYLTRVGNDSVNGLYYSLFQDSALCGLGASVSPPALGENPTHATVGALRIDTTPQAGRATYLEQGACGAYTAQGTPGDDGVSLLLYDRLWHCSGLACNSGAVQPLPANSITRGGAEGVEIWIETYAAATTVTTWTIAASYTNEAATAGRTATYAASWRGVGYFGTAKACFPLPLEGSDLGVTSVESVQITTPLASAGNFGVTLVRPIAWITGDSKHGTRWLVNVNDVFRAGLPQVDAGACLSFITDTNTYTPHSSIELTFVEA
jgi:hypothetical protein